jgi:D-aspartate ligase
MFIRNPAVVTPFDEHMGLDIARSLSSRGIPVYGLDSNRDAVGRYSKHARFVLCPQLEEDGGVHYLKFLLDFGKSLGRKTVLFPLSDSHTLFCSRHRSVLQSYFEFVMPDHDLMFRLTTKDGLNAVAKEFNIPVPKTITCEAGREINDMARNLSYPAILKPAASASWQSPEMTRLLRRGLFAGRPKVIYCRNPEELAKAYATMARLDNGLVIQEVVPGADDRLVYLSFCLNRESEPLAIFGGRKCRVIPAGFGSASYARSAHLPEAVELVLRLLSATRYQGLGGIEFKKDPRDEGYKLIEFNTRFGMWDGLSVKCGIDLPYIAYRDALRMPVQPRMSYQDDVIWIDWQRDMRASLSYMRQGKLTLGQWLRSLKGKKMWAIYSKKDWLPGAAFTLSLFMRLLKRLTRPQAKGQG